MAPPGQEQRCVPERDDLAHCAADGDLEGFGYRRGQWLSGGVTRRHQWDVLFGDTEIRPPEPERIEDLGGKDLADVSSGGRRDDLAHQWTPRHAVVDVHQAGPVERFQLAELSRAYSVSSILFRSGLGPVANGTPALWVMTCRIVVRSLPWLV